jgi:long-chain acyl-CoA synthetase
MSPNALGASQVRPSSLLASTGQYDRYTGPGGPFELRSNAGPDAVERFGTAPESLAVVAGRLLAASEDHESVVLGDERTQWSTVRADILAFSAFLRHEVGLQPGDGVAIAMRNYPEWIVAFWGAQLVGAVVVPINAWLSQSEGRAVLERVRPSLVVVDDERLDLLGETCRAVGARIVHVERGAPQAAGVWSWAAAVADRAPSTSGDPVSRAASDTAVVLFTSGTTGRQKGVRLSHENLITTLLSMQLRAQARDDARRDQGGTGSDARGAGGKRALVSFPFFHVAGLTTLIFHTVQRNTMVLLERWDPRVAAALVRDERITDTAGPPTLMSELAQELIREGEGPGSLESVGIGGSRASSAQLELLAHLHRAGVVVGSAYGMTETTGAVIVSSGEDLLAGTGSLGRCLPTVGLRIVSPSGEVLRDGEVGEIQLRGPQMTPGYVDEDGPSDLVDGWLATGDLGRVTADGRVELTGRQKDVIIRGGENIAASEVEAALETHPAVTESAVIGVPHERYGEVPVAVVLVAEGVSADPEEILAFVATRLAYFKVPVDIRVSHLPLPRNTLGKIQKDEVRRRFFADSADLRLNDTSGSTEASS